MSKDYWLPGDLLCDFDDDDWDDDDLSDYWPDLEDEPDGLDIFEGIYPVAGEPVDMEPK